jgi:hypothetical protein
MGSCFHVLHSRLIFSGTKGSGSRFHVLRSRARFRRYGGRRVSITCITQQDSFSAIPRESGPVFMFCVPGIIFSGTEGVRSRFHVFRSLTCFWGCGGRRVRFSCFVRLDSFSAVPRVLGPVFMFCTTGVVSRGTEGIGSRYHVFRSRTHFRRYRGRQVQFSFFALQNSFSAVPRASGPIFMFCASGLIFDGTEGVGSRFPILRARTHFWRHRGHQIPLSCFTLPDSFSAVPRASDPILTRSRFPRYQGRHIQFSFFALKDSFSAVPRASGPVFMFCAPGHVFGGMRVSGPIFMFYVPD